MKRLNTVFGFTLIELIIVIAILGVLASLISGNFITSLKKGRDAQRKADLEHVQRALELYYEDNKEYPQFDIFAVKNSQLCVSQIAQECSSLSPAQKSYMNRLPADPSGTKYKYYYPSSQKYGLYACLDNALQILPYVSTAANYGSAPAMTCSTTCKDLNNIDTTCVWGLADTNSIP